MDEFEKSWLLGAATDSQLADCSTVEELRLRLQKLSDALSNEDAKCPSSVFQQLTFDGTNANPCFEPNRFKKDLGVDGRKITAYYRYAVKSPEHAIAAVEFACDAIPSVLLAAEQGGVSPSTPKGGPAEALSSHGPPATASSVAQARQETGLRGALLQGGFKAVGNGKTCLVPFGVTHIVNTAKGLGNFFPKFKAFERSAAEVHQASTLHLDWVDGGGQPISAEALRTAVLFTHSARCAGGSVLVHCAQGRSRSGAVAVAYVAALLEMENGEAAAAAAAARGGEAVEGEAHSALRVAAAEGKAAALFTSTKVVDLALVVVQAGRRMAQPNPHFMAQLHAHAQAGLFKALARELVPSLAPPAEEMGDGGGGGGGGGSALNGASGGTKCGLNVPKECGDGCGEASAPADTKPSTSFGGPMRTTVAVAGAAQATTVGTSAATAAAAAAAVVVADPPVVATATFMTTPAPAAAAAAAAPAAAAAAAAVAALLAQLSPRVVQALAPPALLLAPPPPPPLHPPSSSACKGEDFCEDEAFRLAFHQRLCVGFVENGVRRQAVASAAAVLVDGSLAGALSKAGWCLGEVGGNKEGASGDAFGSINGSCRDGTRSKIPLRSSCLVMNINDGVAGGGGDDTNENCDGDGHDRNGSAPASIDNNGISVSRRPYDDKTSVRVLVVPLPADMASKAAAAGRLFAERLCSSSSSSSSSAAAAAVGGGGSLMAFAMHEPSELHVTVFHTARNVRQPPGSYPRAGRCEVEAEVKQVQRVLSPLCEINLLPFALTLTESGALVLLLRSPPSLPLSAPAPTTASETAALPSTAAPSTATTAAAAAAALFQVTSGLATNLTGAKSPLDECRRRLRAEFPSAPKRQTTTIAHVTLGRIVAFKTTEDSENSVTAATAVAIKNGFVVGDAQAVRFFSGDAHDDGINVGDDHDVSWLFETDDVSIASVPSSLSSSPGNLRPSSRDKGTTVNGAEKARQRRAVLLARADAILEEVGLKGIFFSTNKLHYIEEHFEISAKGKVTLVVL